MNHFAIIVIAYNRPASLLRLLDSVSKAYYSGDLIDIIISIDNSGDDSVEVVANNFIWKNGKKIVKTYPLRLGLRDHIIKCGDYLYTYDAVVVLEDDIFVSPNFYIFMKKAVDFYIENDKIAGISLYSHSWNINAHRPFIPASSKYDTYFMQYAQSWGQIWMKRQWFDFKKWYLDNINTDFNVDYIPKNISAWPKSSWLKYHIKYCIDYGKYFVYPYISLSTNFTDKGEHNNSKSSATQVPMMFDYFDNYTFSPFSKNDKAVFYDSFFERENIGYVFDYANEELCVDLYGLKSKSLYKRYLLTSEFRNYKIIKRYGLDLRPHEMNAIYNIHGNEIFLYDTESIVKNKGKINIEVIKWFYDNKALRFKTFFHIFTYKLLTKIREKFNI